MLLQAFRTIDLEKKGYIEIETMRNLLAEHGDSPFFAKEIDIFIKAAKDSETGHIYYEDYVALLSKYSHEEFGTVGWY